MAINKRATKKPGRTKRRNRASQLNLEAFETRTGRKAILKCFNDTPLKDYDTVGVRFIFGNKPDRVYTYKIRQPYNRAHVHPGALLVADTPAPGDGAGDSPGRPNSYKRVCCVVRIDAEPQDTDSAVTYKFISERVAPL